MRHNFEAPPDQTSSPTRDLYAILEPTGIETVELDVTAVDAVVGEEARERCEYEHMPLSAYAVPLDMLKRIGLDALPDGIAVVGGAARAMLQTVVFGERASIRDVDLTAIAGMVDESVDLDALSRTYMEDDYKDGYGIKEEPVDGYFATRDFTINEVIVVNGVILATRRAVEDLRSKTIRPTEYESEGWYHGIGPKLMMKALLMQAVFERQYGEARCSGFEPYDTKPFYVALALNKSFQHGMPVARRFLELAGFRNIETEEDVMSLARGLVAESDFTFRGSDLAERVYDDEINSFWDDLPDPIDDAHDKAVAAMGRYAGVLPPGVDIRDYES